MQELSARVRGIVWLCVAAAHGARLHVHEHVRSTLEELEQRGRDRVRRARLRLGARPSARP